jgi:hypothetical protein
VIAAATQETPQQHYPAIATMVTPTVLATAADAVPTTQTTALSVCVAVLPAEGWVIPWATAWVTVHDPPGAIGQAQGFDPTVRPYRSSPYCTEWWWGTMGGGVRPATQGTFHLQSVTHT